MQPHIVFLVLLAATFHASWNALLKVGNDRLLTLSLLSVWSGVFAAGFVWVFGGIHIDSWFWMGITLVLHTGYKVFLLLAYRVGDLSQVYPVARGSGPMLVALFSAPLLGENLQWQDWLACALISGGILSLTFERGIPGKDQRATLLFALGTGTFIAAYTIVDAIGVRHSGNALAYSGWLFLLDAFIQPIYAVWVRGKRATVAFLRTSWWKGLIAGGLSFSSFTMILVAMSQERNTAGVAALRETSVILAAVIGTLVLGEAFGRWRLFAALLIAAGIIGFNVPR